jgi:hypothetical protein
MQLVTSFDDGLKPRARLRSAAGPVSVVDRVLTVFFSGGQIEAEQIKHFRK